MWQLSNLQIDSSVIQIVQSDVLRNLVDTTAAITNSLQISEVPKMDLTAAAVFDLFRLVYLFIHLFTYVFIISYFFSNPIHFLRPSCPAPLSRNSDLGSHSRPFSPLPTTVRTLHFYREKDSVLSSLIVNSRRIVPTHAIIGALDSWCHF